MVLGVDLERTLRFLGAGNNVAEFIWPACHAGHDSLGTNASSTLESRNSHSKLAELNHGRVSKFFWG